MRIYIFLFLIAGIQASGCKSKSSGSTEKTYALIEFKETVFDYGEIAYGSNGRCKFEFINSSNEPLLINNVRESCGCTDTFWPQNPLQPGEKGIISIIYDTRIAGEFRKSVTIYSNAQNSPTTIYVTGNVLKSTRH